MHQTKNFIFMITFWWHYLGFKNECQSPKYRNSLYYGIFCIIKPGGSRSILEFSGSAKTCSKGAPYLGNTSWPDSPKLMRIYHFQEKLTQEGKAQLVNGYFYLEKYSPSKLTEQTLLNWSSNDASKSFFYFKKTNKYIE